MVFEDIKPAAEYHYLAIPIQHIDDCNDLTPKHIGLLKKLKKVGEKVLNDHFLNKLKCVSALVPDESGPRTIQYAIPPIKAIFGFHVPPYHSQHHLHMHIVAPADQLSIQSADRVLGTNSFRMISVGEFFSFLFLKICCDLKKGLESH